jgi:hypothetical protein
MSEGTTQAQQDALARGRVIGAPLGGRAVANKRPPDRCPRCGRPMEGRTWHGFLGHLGLHGLADNHFGGDVAEAQRHLRENGLAAQDPAPWNGAFPKRKPLP